MDIILSLVFAAPLLVIMIYPAMKISKFLGNYFANKNKNRHEFLLVKIQFFIHKIWEKIATVRVLIF